MNRLLLALLTAATVPASAALAQTRGDAKRGGEIYRACASCHSLEPGTHLTGPSLADLWGAPAGRVDAFVRYSQGLKSAEFNWDADTLNAWLANPRTMIPDTYMTFRGIADDQARADLIAFLEIAMKPGGTKIVVERGLAPAEYLRGQKPDALKQAPPDARVTKIRHCKDSYFITTANGTERPYWEMNIRLKLDTRDTGPEPGKPVIVGGGMVGDRASVVFSSLQELTHFIKKGC